MNDHEKIHAEILSNKKQERINQLEQDNKKQLEKLERVERRLVELEEESGAETQAGPAAQINAATEILSRHIDLLEAALIGAGQEAGIYTIRGMVYTETAEENT